jgi:diguanylate cyclase (GGDEF)-like protein/PAS domain S-box-containing protein
LYAADTQKLQNRISTFAMFGILLTGLIVGLATALPFYHQLRKNSELSMRFHVHAQAQTLSQQFSKLIDIAQQLTSRTQIRKRLEQYNQGKVSLTELVQFSVPRLEDAMAQTGEIAGLIRLDAQGNPVVRVGKNSTISNWPIVPAKGRKPILGKPQSINGKPILIVAAPILDRQGERVGTDVVIFNTSILQILLNDNQTLGNSAKQYLALPGQYLAIQPTGKQAQLELEALNENISTLIMKKQAGPFYIPAQEDGLLFHTQLPGFAEWQLAVTTTTAAIYRPVWNQIVPALMTIILMVLTGVALTVRIIKPLAGRVVTTSRNLTELSIQQQALLELAHGFSFKQNTDGIFTYASPGISEVLGINPDDLPLPQTQLLTDNPINETLSLHHDMILTLGIEAPPFIVEMKHKKGSRVLLEIFARPLVLDGALAGITGVARDVTERMKTEEELRLAASVFEGSHECIMIMDIDKKVIDVNHAFTKITGYSVPEISALQLREFLTSEQFDEQTCELIWHVVDEHDSWQGEVWYRRKNGEVFPAWQNMSALRNDQGEPIRYIGVFTDISEKKATEERIHHLAHFDVLTGLPNRVLLEDRLDNALRRMRRAHSRLGVLFLDLDRFKTINDSLGHPVGDKLLQSVAKRLKDVVREQDIVARLGGDEFLLILEGLSEPEYAGAVAQKVIDNLCEKVQIDQHELFVGASIGISIYPDDGGDPETLIKNADVAMYRAKDTGRNNYQFYTPELTRLSMERFELERDLRLALERDELQLHYQPQVAFDSHKCIGVEALLRWQHPERGMIPPDKFIPLAEETGLILSLGRWVLLKACQEARKWQEQGTPLAVAVNISGHQIIFDNLLSTVKEALQETGLDPTLLELEITEGFMLNHAEEGVKALEQLHTLGISLSIDDFGTGYSSLSYLKRLPIDRLKIDKSFVQGLPESGDDAAIITTIIAMAKSLNLGVIAEGVETETQLHFLNEMDCNEFQGFYLSRPLPVDDLNSWRQQFDNYTQA